MHIDKETVGKIKADIRMAINALAETKYHDFIPQMQADMARMDLERALRTIEAEEAEEARINKEVEDKRELKMKAAEDFFAANNKVRAARKSVNINTTIDQAKQIKKTIEEGRKERDEAYDRWKSL